MGPGDTETISGQLYRLEVTAEGEIRLSYLEEEQVLWCWELKEIPGMFFTINAPEFSASSEMDWFSEGAYSGDIETVNATTFPGKGTVHLECHDIDGAKPDTLTVSEEYHHGGQTEYREYTLIREKNGSFPLPEDALQKRYEDADQYILYRVQWEGGEFLFCLKFK